MTRLRVRVLGTAVAGVLLVALSACGNVAEPELAAAPNSQGGVLAAPETTVPPPPTTGPPTTTSTPPPTTTKRPTTPKAAAPTARPEAAQAQTVAWVPAGGDEFGADGLDGGKWIAYDSAGSWNNGRRSADAVSQAGGVLTITARPRVGDGQSGGVAYTKGQTYGHWEFRARVDKGKGYGAAILLWPDSEKWPQDGELDMLEVPDADRGLAHTYVHWGADNKTWGTKTPGDFSQWHTFGFDWLPDRLTGYIDGVKTFETTDKAMIPTGPMHVTIQLDQGPAVDWMPGPDQTTPDEVKLQLDYMRVSAMPGTPV